MIVRKFKIIEPTGLHARPVAVLVGTAGKFQSEIEITCREDVGNLKSILNVLSLMVRQGDEIEISINGVDEANAMLSIEGCLKEMKII